MSCWGWQLGLSGMRDRFGIFGAVIRIRKLSLLLVMTLRMPNTLHVPHGNRYFPRWKLHRYPCACGFFCVRLKYPTSFLAPLSGNGSCASLEPSSSMYFFAFITILTSPQTTTNHMDSTPIHKFSAPKVEFSEPPQSSKPITASIFELKPGFIAMVQVQSFSRLKDENPYTHLREFEHLCLLTVLKY